MLLQPQRIPKNHLFCSKEVDAFTQDWAGQEFLWCNPPFTMMDEVVRKIHAEGAEVLLVLPEWTNKPWWSLATGLMSKSQYFPLGSRIFENETGKMGATHWGLRLMYIPRASPCQCARNTEDIILRCPRLHPKSIKKEEKSHIRVTQVPEGHKKDIHLKIMVSLDKDGVRHVDECSALIDTGAEVCLIRQGLLPEFLFQPAENPLRLIAVNKQRLAGGDKEVLITMVISGPHVIDKEAV